jgi:hypothetical protein
MATTYAIPDGRVAMAATLWTGNGVNSRNIDNTVNGVSFQPDLVWLKSRSQAYAHRLVDSVRGGGKELSSNNTGAESSNDPNGSIYTLNSNGFQLYGSTDNTNVNTNGATLVGWQWKAGGTAVSNTAGSITSSVSANTTAGFSVVTYTGTGSNATVGHGLGVAPSMVIVKNRGAGNAWDIYTAMTGANAYLSFTTAAVASGLFPSVATSSVFSITGGAGGQGASGGTYVAYCFAPVAGYSAFGSYTGNGSADGPFVFLGLRPRWVMVKCSSGVESWYVFDSSRDTYNVVGNLLVPNQSIAESTFASFDFLSNGLKVRTTNSLNNTNGATYIYAAFAENPFKYANAR